MASIQDIASLIIKIADDSGGSIPGLSTDEVLNKLAEKNEQLKSAIEEATSEEERKKILERFKNTLKSYVDEQIAVIKTSYAEVKEGISLLKETIASTIATTVIPPAIGTPPVAPNPAYALAENKQKINNLVIIITGLVSSFLQMLSAAAKIDFEIPDSVIVLLNALIDIKKLIKKIPA